jgi:sulfoxide reductase heme-binding subunit YedZ
MALVPAGLTLWLLLWRVAPAGFRNSLAGLVALAAGATVITALGEAGWYALASGFSPRLVLAANFSFARYSAAQYLTADFALILVLIAARRLQRYALAG